MVTHLDNEVYQENLKRTLQKFKKKHQDLDINKVVDNSLISKALNNKKSVPKVHQASLFDYFK